MADINYLQLVLSDFSLKQLFYINWFNNNLDVGVANRNTIIIDLLRECTGEKLEQWTPITIEQSLMAINALGFLNRVEEKLLDTKLNTYLTSKGCSNMIVEPYIKKCCDTKLKMIIGRKIIIFKIDGSYTGTLTYGNCLKCMKQYSHNYFMYQDKKYVTYDSVFSSNLVYLGGNYGYDKKFIRWLSNSILYLYSGFENFAKCYNATNNQISKTVDTANINLCPTRIQDFWFLYNFINISFFYTESTILQVPSNCDRQKLVEFMNTNYDRLNKHFVNYWALHKEHHSCGTTCSMAFVTDGFQKSSRFICGNIKMVVRNKELGYVQVGCGNRPEYEAKHKRKQDNQCKSITTSTNGSNDDTTDALCRSCKLNPISHDVEEEIITNNECNINRNPRFVNGKVRSYGVIYTMYNCGIVVDFLEINLSEQVFITLLHWFSMLDKISDLTKTPTIFIYDNACSVWLYFKTRFHTTKTLVLTQSAQYLDSCEMFIDRLHQKTHTRPMCRTERNIDLKPHLDDVNTMVCEQNNSWLKQFINILCNLSGQRSKFYYLFLFHLLNCRRCSFNPEKKPHLL